MILTRWGGRGGGLQSAIIATYNSIVHLLLAETSRLISIRRLLKFVIINKVKLLKKSKSSQPVSRVWRRFQHIT